MFNTKYISFGLDFFSAMPELSARDEMELFSDTLNSCIDSMFRDGICRYFTTEEIKEHFSIFDENSQNHPLVLDNIKEKIKAYYVSLGCMLMGHRVCETIRSYQAYDDDYKSEPSDAVDEVIRENLSEIMECYKFIPKQVAHALSDYFGRWHEYSANMYAGEFLLFVMALHFECGLYQERRLKSSVCNYEKYVNMLKVESPEYYSNESYIDS